MNPIYTAENCRIHFELYWSLSAFWREPALPPERWLELLRLATEPDGVRILEHRITGSEVSQFLLSTRPHVAPQAAIRSVKGRLQYIVRDQRPKAFHRNYSILSVGSAKREAVEQYVATQLSHHRMADERVQAALERWQIMQPNVDLSRPRRSAHGEFLHNLHMVFVHEARWREVHEEVFEAIHKMILAVQHKRGQQLSHAGICADHIHLTLGCGIDEAPQDVALSYLNNLAYAQGMKPVYQ